MPSRAIYPTNTPIWSVRNFRSRAAAYSGGLLPAHKSSEVNNSTAIVITHLYPPGTELGPRLIRSSPAEVGVSDAGFACITVRAPIYTFAANCPTSGSIRFPSQVNVSVLTWTRRAAFLIAAELCSSSLLPPASLRLGCAGQ